MSDNYSVIFRGDIVLGKNLVDVKKKLAQLFKVDDARIERMFTGKPVPLKASIPMVQAKKYQAVLNQVGIVTEIIDNSSALNKNKSSAKPSASRAPINKNASAERSSKSVPSAVASDPSQKSTANVAESTAFTIAPTGSDLIDNKKPSTPAPVDTAHISLSPQEGTLIKEGERLTPLPSSVDIDSLAWDIADVGEILLKESEREHVEALNIDTDDLSLSAAEGNLMKESERVKVETVNIDTDDLSLSAAEGNLMKESEKVKVETVNIDTDDLSLSDAIGNLITEAERPNVKEVDVDISHIKLARHNPFM